MVDEKKRISGLVPLKELVPLRPWRSRTAAFPGHGRVRYMKVKDGVMEDGKRVYWRVRKVGRQREAKEQFEIPYEGVFEFIHNRFIKAVQLWFDKLLGSLCGLPMPD